MCKRADIVMGYYYQQEKPGGGLMKLNDNGGRREISDRRLSSEPVDFPDRRSHKDRRSCPDRRSGVDRRSASGFRVIAGMDRRVLYRWNSHHYLSRMII